MFASKLTLYVFIVQIVSLNLLLAKSSPGQSVKDIYISIDIEGVNLVRFLNEIENKTELSFLYDELVLNDTKELSASHTKVSVGDLLLRLSEQTGFGFRQINENIYVTKIVQDEKAPERTTQPLKVTITGSVIDAETKEPMIGASVVVKDTRVGTITDVDGNFTLELPNGANTLIFSYVGYLKKEVPINNQSSLIVELEPDIAALSEVVVIGYGEVEKKDVTGSVVSVDSELIRETNKVNAVQSIQGQLPGVDIQSVGNKPGDGYYIRIRGNNTVNSGEGIPDAGYSPGQNPLFVVDGVFVNDISFINPGDIEKIDVLKDASATAIYGSRGSAGVVIITTKRGKSGAMTVQYDNYFGIRQAYNEPDIFEGEEFVTFFKDAAVGVRYASGDLQYTRDDVVLSDYLRPNELENIAQGEYVDWVDLIKQNGFQMNHSLSASGGNDKATYGVGFGYTRDEGTFPGEDLERYNIRANVSFDATDWLSFGYNGYVTYSVRNQGSQEGFRSAYRLRPTGDAYDENGDPLFFPLEDEDFITNPLFEESGIIEETKTLNYFGNFSATVKFMEGLDFTTRFSPNLTFDRYGQFRGIYTKSSAGNGGRRRAYVDHSSQTSYTWDHILNFEKRFGDMHHLNATLVASSWLNNYELHQTEVRNFNTDEFLFYNQGIASDIRKLENSLTKETLLSYTARFNYTLANKYIFTVTGRYDGASKLAEDNKWAFFPSAAFAWRVADEPFLNNQGVLSDLKLRLSYGVTGNTGSGGGLRPLGSQSNIGFGFTNLGDQPAQTAFVTSLANQDLTWEKTAEINLGFDFGFLRNRLYGSLDVYSRKTTDLILARSIPVVTGYSSVFQNVGEVTNKGIELALNSVNLDNGSLKWTTSLNFAKNVNELTELYDGLNELPFFSVQAASIIHRVGEPVGSLYTYEYEGVWQLDEVEEAQLAGQQPGQVKVKDQDGNGEITDADRTIIGSLQPDWTGGISNTIKFKGVDFTFFVYTRQGVMSHSWFHESHAWDGDTAPGRFNGLNTNYWTPDNPTNDWFQPGNGGPYTEVMNYHDVSFTKVGYITLGYTLPAELISSIGLGSVRIYATAQNPFIFTQYEGWDPETAGRNTYRAAFLSRSFIGGLNIRF